MKRDTKDLLKLRAEFNENFKTGAVQYRSFHDLLWQISINGVIDNEIKPVVFHVDVTGKHGNELVLAFQSGGFKRTSVFFVENDYNECVDICERINESFFEIDSENQMKIISKSMNL